MEKAVFGQFVAENRRALGLTQKDLAERLHVTDKAVSKWERGLSFPDVTLLEPLAAVFGLGVTELVSCRRAEPSPAPAEWADQEFSPQEEKPEELAVQTLLHISGESLRAERKRKRRLTAALALLLLAAVAAVVLLLCRSEMRESGLLSVLHAEAVEHELLLYAERDGHLLCLSYGGSGAEQEALEEHLAEGGAILGEYSWDRRTYRGRLLSWQAGGIAIGGPMDEVGAAQDLYAYDGDALFGYPHVLMELLARQPDPQGRGYLSTYIFYLGDDSADWYRHADIELLRVSGCLGYGAYGDGGWRTADYNRDGVRELLVRTPWPEKPCILYEWADGAVVETWLDELPSELTGPAE